MFRRRMIGFRTCLVHMKNLHYSAFLCYKIDRKTFYCSSNFAFRNTVDSFDNYFKTNSIRSSGIVDSALFKELNNDVIIIKRLMRKGVCTTKHECTSVCTLTHKGINKRLSHFGASSLFTRNHFTAQNSCNAKQVSSFSGQENSPYFTGVLKHISESAPVGFAQESLVWLHSYTGLPWWATIITTTIAIRATTTLPLAIYQHYIIAKLDNLKYEMDDLIKSLKRETTESMVKFNWPEEYTRNTFNRAVKEQWNELIVRENCHPMKSVVLVLIQIPLWITMSFSLRNLCSMLPTPSPSAYQTYVELTTGGFGWILNLAATDSYFILPVFVCLLNLTIIEIQTMTRIKESTRIQKFFTNFFRLLSLAIIPIAVNLPSSVTLYWMTSSVFGLCQNLLLLSPKFRRFGRIPETEIELSHPYSHLYEQIRHKYNFIPRTVKR